MVRFVGARFSGGEVDFGAVFSGGEVSFALAEFSGGRVGFSGARFSGGTVTSAALATGHAHPNSPGQARRPQA